MKTRKCCICEGQIVNGRCVICGMPYRNDEELYHLNENRRDHYSHASEAAQQKLRDLERPRTYGSQAEKHSTAGRQANAKTAYVGNKARTAANYRKPGASAAYGSARAAASYAKGSKKKSKTGFWVAILVIAVVLCELWPRIGAWYTKYSPFGSREVTVKSISEGMSNLVTEPEGEYVVDDFETTLEAGEYVIGQQLPSGIYRVELEGDNGEVEFSLEGLDNGFYEFWVFYGGVEEPKDYMIQALEDCRMFTGGIVKLKGQGSLKFTCEKAYYQGNWEVTGNPLTKEYPMMDTMVSGVDFEPGMYDLVLEEGAESVYVNQQQGEDVLDTYYMSWDSNYGMARYRNLQLPEGTTLTLGYHDGTEVYLTPSPEIYVEKE
ncbi:MAG: hypothetical protein ACOYBE_03345 [Blautia sp.]